MNRDRPAARLFATPCRHPCPCCFTTLAEVPSRGGRRPNPEFCRLNWRNIALHISTRLEAGFFSARFCHHVRASPLRTPGSPSLDGVWEKQWRDPYDSADWAVAASLLSSLGCESGRTCKAGMGLSHQNLSLKKKIDRDSAPHPGEWPPVPGLAKTPGLSTRRPRPPSRAAALQRRPVLGRAAPRVENR